MKNLALLIIRLVAGMTLVAHGYPKLFGGAGKNAPDVLATLFGPNFAQEVREGGPESVGSRFEQMEIPLPQASAYLSGAAEFGGGLALLTGTFTRLAALAVAANMLVAIQKVHWKNGLVGQGGFEYPAQLLAEAGALFLAGPGAFSVDGIFGAVKAGGDAVGRGGDALGDAAGKAKRRGSKAIQKVAEQAGSLSLPV